MADLTPSQWRQIRASVREKIDFLLPVFGDNKWEVKALLLGVENRIRERLGMASKAPYWECSPAEKLAFQAGYNAGDYVSLPTPAHRLN